MRFMAKVLLAAALVSLAAGHATAGGGLAVAPVSVEFIPGVTARAIQISNPGDKAIDVQVRLFAWSLEAGADRHEPSRDIGVSPPMFRLEPGARQVLRLAVLNSGGVSGERNYRLFVDQLPDASLGGQLQMPVRMVLPVFVASTDVKRAPRPGPNERLVWRSTRVGERLRLSATNRDIRRVKVINLAYVAGGRRHVINAGLAGYVLAGQQRTWEMPYPAGGGDLTVTGDTDEAPFTAHVAAIVD